MSGDNFGFRGSNKGNHNRRFSGGGPRPDHNGYKQAEAKERDEAWRKLTPEQQLSALDGRLGKGVGATRQRARLALEIEKARLRSQPEAKGATPVGQLIESDGGRIKAKERRAAEQAKRPNK